MHCDAEPQPPLWEAVGSFELLDLLRVSGLF